MNDERIAMLSERILGALDQGRRLDEATFRRLFALVAEATEWTAGHEWALLLELEQDIAARYTYGDVSDSDGFDLGTCWGALEVLRERLLAEEERARREERIRAVRKRYDLVSLVGREPGIIQGELAKRLGQKKSNFSQKLARLDRYRIFTFNTVGKVKHVYLTHLGEDALEAVEQELRREAARGQDGNANFANTTVYRAYLETCSFDGTGALSNSSVAFGAWAVHDGREPNPALQSNAGYVFPSMANSQWELESLWWDSQSKPSPRQ